MKKSTFASLVKETYGKSRKLLAYILVLAAFGLRFIPGTEFALASFTALCFIILQILFEIHKSVTEKELPKCFSSFMDASQSIAQSMDDYIHSIPHPSIRVLGISLFHLWPMLDPYLTKILASSNPPHLSLEIALIDPSSAEQKKINPGSPASALGSIKKIKGFVTQHGNEIRKFKWSLSVWTYRYTPHLFGILIGEDLLFVGRSFWDNGVLRGGANEIEMFDKHDPHGSQKIEEFIGWFNKCKQRKVQL